MNISILFPISKDLSKDRKFNFNFLYNYYQSILPTAEFIIGIDDSNKDKFCKSRAINNAAKKALKDILFIVDIDMYFGKIEILEGIKKLDSYGWAIPYNNLIKLNKEQTILFIKENKIDQTANNYKFHVRAGGGQLVNKEIFNLVQGYDERFVGWGGEDTSFCASIECLYKPGITIVGNGYHLYHKRQSEIDLYKKLKTKNRKLRDKYWQYANNKQKIEMQQLINSRGEEL